MKYLLNMKIDSYHYPGQINRLRARYVELRKSGGENFQEFLDALFKFPNASKPRPPRSLRGSMNGIGNFTRRLTKLLCLF